MLLVKMIRWADNPPLLIDRLKLRKFLFAGAFFTPSFSGPGKN